MNGKAEIVFRRAGLVHPGGIIQGDLALSGGKIAAVGIPGSLEGGRILDLHGKLVFPGFIDPHLHPVYLDDLAAVSLGGLFGGVTATYSYVPFKPGDRPGEVIRRWKQEWAGRCPGHYGFHGAFFDTAAQLDDIPGCLAQGVSSFKMFLAYAKLGWMTRDPELFKVMRILAREGGCACLHAQNGDVIDVLEDEFLARGADWKDAFLLSQPASAETEAINRALTWGRETGCAVYIPHISSKEGIALAAELKWKGHRFWAETCPQYLGLTWEMIRDRGPQGKVGPAIRREEDRQALWEGIRAGWIDTIGSDHAPKAKYPRDDFFPAPFGSPQVETTFAILWEEGVNAGRIGPPDVARIFSENAARFAGLYPRKGSLLPGADADLVVVDPEKTWTIRQADLHGNAPYSLYEGKTIRGGIDSVWINGKETIREGELTAGEPGGEFLAIRAVSPR